MLNEQSGLPVDNSLAEQIIEILGRQTSSATADQRKQATKMLYQIANTRQYGELVRQKLEDFEQKRDLEQRRELLLQQISMIKSRLAQIQMVYQQHRQQLDILHHQSEQLHFELEQSYKQEMYSSELERLRASQDNLKQHILNLGEIISIATTELHQQEMQFVDTQQQFQTIEQELEPLPVAKVLRDSKDNDQRKLQQQQQQISSVRKYLDRTQVEYGYHLKELTQLHSQIEQLYSEQMKLLQQGISSEKNRRTSLIPK